MVRSVNRVAQFLLILNYQSGFKWAVRVAMIAHRASPRNCAFFFMFLILTTEWQ